MALTPLIIRRGADVSSDMLRAPSGKGVAVLSIGPVVEPVTCQVAAALPFCLGIVLAPAENPSGETPIEAPTAVVLHEIDDGRACNRRSRVRWRIGTHAANAQQERSDR